MVLGKGLDRNRFLTDDGAICTALFALETILQEIVWKDEHSDYQVEVESNETFR